MRFQIRLLKSERFGKIIRRAGTRRAGRDDAVIVLFRGKLLRLAALCSSSADAFDGNAGFADNRCDLRHHRGCGDADVVFGSGTVQRVELHLVRLNLADILQETFCGFCRVVDAFRDEDFQPHLRTGNLAEFDHGVRNGTDCQAFRRTVHFLKLLFIGAVERGNDQVDGGAFAADFGIHQRHAFCQKADFDVRIFFLDVRNNRPDPGMKQRLAGSGEGEKVDVRMTVQRLVDLFQRQFGREIFLALGGLIGGFPALAVNAVHRAGFVRNQVDTERNAEPSGRNRTEDAGLLCGIHEISPSISVEIFLFCVYNIA